MNIAAIVRKGFSAAQMDELSWSRNAFYYQLAEPFAPLWEKVLQSGADYALFVDDIVGCTDRQAWLLQKILDSSPHVHGITFDADGLEAVYGFTPPSTTHRRMPWTVTPLRALPPWLTLLRVAAWEPAALLTPEFFLLAQAHKKVLLRTVEPRLELDAVRWAGDLIAAAAPALSADYVSVLKDNTIAGIPRQFQVVLPGAGKISAALQHPLSSPMFSVICPSIRPDFLEEAVTSVIEQSFADWELRIGIDGPKEVQLKKIIDILNPFLSDPRIHIRHYKHMGTGPIRKMLSDQARGEFIVGMDDDDRLPKNALEGIAKAIGDNPGIPILRGGTRLFGLIEAYLPPRPRYLVGSISNDIFEVNQPYAVRRDILAMLGGFEWDPDLKHAGEDSDLFLKADREQLPVHLIDEPLYERRLSTFNQTLDCTADECLRHVHNLYRKHNPTGWTLSDVRFSGNGPMIHMQTAHRLHGGEDTVVCATHFMNFQQVGSREGVVVDLEVTSLCNAACRFCPRAYLNRKAKFIKLDTVRRLAASLQKEAGATTVVLCGIGEPTLHPELGSLISILAQAGANVGMTTNGWNLTAASVDKLVEAGLSELNVSLNAATPQTHARRMQLGNFDQIYKACKEVAARRKSRWPSLKLHVSFVVTEGSEDEARDFVDEWRNREVSQIWLHPMTNRAGLLGQVCPPGDAARLAEVLSDESRVKVDLFARHDGPSNLCHIAGGIDFISVDGEMLLCAQDYKAMHSYGNIAHEELARLHEHKLLIHLRGETAGTCAQCTFCPQSFRYGQDQSYTIVQAGAV